MPTRKTGEDITGENGGSKLEEDRLWGFSPGDPDPPSVGKVRKKGVHAGLRHEEQEPARGLWVVEKGFQCRVRGDASLDLWLEVPSIGLETGGLEGQREIEGAR